MASPTWRRRALFLFMGIALAFFAATLAERIAGDGAGLLEIYDTTSEGGPGAWVSGLLLLTCALLCLRHWVPLAIALAIAAVDEVAQFHEAAPAAIMGFLQDDVGLAKNPARLVAAVATIAVVAAAVAAVRPWYRSLPVPTRRLVAISAALFLGGAVGLELVARLFDRSQEGLTLWLGPFEELLEMAGAAILAYALWPTAAPVSFGGSRLEETGAS